MSAGDGSSLGVLLVDGRKSHRCLFTLLIIIYIYIYTCMLERGKIVRNRTLCVCYHRMCVCVPVCVLCANLFSTQPTVESGIN